MTRRIAVVGGGISGLAAAWKLGPSANVTLYEAAAWFGGHAHTVEVALDGVRHGVDTGFLVFNTRTYPRLMQLFGRLGVETAASDMSFSVQSGADGLEWSGSDIASVFAQRANLARPRFWRMLLDIARFNRDATREASSQPPSSRSVGDFLDANGYSEAFRDWYFLPMVACIWSCPTARMLDFPIATLARFCHNHGLLQVTGRPPWRTVRGGSRHYVAKMLETIGDARLATPVRRIRRRETGGVAVVTDSGSEPFDAVVLACHSDQSLALLADASADERRVLGAIGYHDNRAVLHTDTSLLPRRRRAWAAWNYERGGAGAEAGSVCLHYLIGRLQPLPFATPVVVSLNPIREPDPQRVIETFSYAHPVLNAGAIDAQADLAAIQGRRDTWYCGAWVGHGFHEDGLASGLEVAARITDGIVGTVGTTGTTGTAGTIRAAEADLGVPAEMAGTAAGEIAIA